MAKTYLRCSAKARETNFGQVIKLGIKVDDFIAFARQHVNDRGYVNLDITPRKEQGQSKNTLEGTIRLFDKGFVSKTEKERDEIAFENSRLKVQTAETARDLSRTLY